MGNNFEDSIFLIQLGRATDRLFVRIGTLTIEYGAIDVNQEIWLG
jgi:hypothetical protein